MRWEHYKRPLQAGKGKPSRVIAEKWGKSGEGLVPVCQLCFAPLSGLPCLP